MRPRHVVLHLHDGDGDVAMEITEVRIFPVLNDMLKAYASFTIDDCFLVRDLKVIEGKKGIFVAMPSRRRANGSYRDTAHPLDTGTRRKIEERVLREYWKVAKKRGLQHVSKHIT